ncbi:unnamed protein product [Phyllotreta striolata]|uniref:Uncharacterized protein n=1 Tax=Phyllotreta striolata TaxID=444603 RepID=A0A9N9XS69_PHYSR|nr:unnamed protein product [Phyllotreta striolata]
MKLLLVFAFIASASVVLCEKYTTKYDNIDLDEILKSERLLKNYVDCVMERGKCTADGAELKKNMPDALKEDCSGCSEKQREGSIKVIRYLVKNKRPIFDELAAKFDPDKTYITRHKADLEKEGITV